MFDATAAPHPSNWEEFERQIDEEALEENLPAEFDEEITNSNSTQCFKETETSKLLSNLKASANAQTKLTDKELLRKAKETWHPINAERDTEPDDRPELPPTRDLDLTVKPLSKQDSRTRSEGPIRISRCRINCTGRSASLTPQTVTPGWESAPGIPKTGALIRILNRVRQQEGKDNCTEHRQSQAWRTYLELSAAAEARASVASASAANSSD